MCGTKAITLFWIEFTISNIINKLCSFNAGLTM